MEQKTISLESQLGNFDQHRDGKVFKMVDFNFVNMEPRVCRKCQTFGLCRVHYEGYKLEKPHSIRCDECQKKHEHHKKVVSPIISDFVSEWAYYNYNAETKEEITYSNEEVEKRLNELFERVHKLNKHDLFEFLHSTHGGIER